MRRWLVVMAKAPRAGRVKTRLAAEIGMVEATRFYRVTLAGLIRAVGSDPRWKTVIAVSPDTALRDPVWPDDVAIAAQGGGDLGDRMQRIMAGLPQGPALIIGSDVPEIRPAHIARAFDLLGRHDAVFGPAEDGGYWLVGLRRRPSVPLIFGNVRWSTRHALADTVANCRGLSVGYADELADIDTAADWRDWRRRSASISRSVR